MRTRIIASLLVLNGLLASNGNASEPTTADLNPLLQAINERLTLAAPVALSKWDSGNAVADPDREVQVIANAISQAPLFGLQIQDVQRLMRAQIEASKQLQNTLLQQWRAAGKAPDTPRANLAKDIRPQLDSLQLRLLQNYARFLPLRDNAHCQATLNAALEHYSAEAAQLQALLLATQELCTTPAK